METLAPPLPSIAEPAMPFCEQVLPGNVTPEQEEGHIGGAGPAPQPLQGDVDQGDPEEESRTGNEGAGT